MKKYFLSFGLIVAFAFYSLLNTMRNPIAPSASLSQATPAATGTNSASSASSTDTSPIVKTTAMGKFKDGTYDGPVTDAYFGNLQAVAVIQGGKLVDVNVPQYPSDRGTSNRINTQALPVLRTEAIQAQSASVNGVSGATQTSQAFNISLAAALAKATN